MKKIVVVDDNMMFLETVKDLIERQKDLKCITFSNPKDALRYVLEEREIIYAVVSDYEMSQMNGLTLAKQIIEKLPIMKIIVMSEHNTKHLRKKALKVGVDENNVRLLCKSDIINLAVLLNTL